MLTLHYSPGVYRFISASSRPMLTTRKPIPRILSNETGRSIESDQTLPDVITFPVANGLCRARNLGPNGTHFKILGSKRTMPRISRKYAHPGTSVYAVRSIVFYSPYPLPSVPNYERKTLSSKTLRQTGQQGKNAPNSAATQKGNFPTCRPCHPLQEMLELQGSILNEKRLLMNGCDTAGGPVSLASLSVGELSELIASEKRPERRRRLRMVREAWDGRTADEVAERVKSSRRRV